MNNFIIKNNLNTEQNYYEDNNNNNSDNFDFFSFTN